ncbi:MAG: TPM domain-containing protein [Bacteroidota bacterium]
MFFTEEEQKRIISAIKEAEKNTSGEIKVHITNSSQNENVVKQAAHVFDQLGLHKTKQRNGVLIYIATDDRQFAIWADDGINKAVPEDFWESTVALMRDHMKAGQYAEALIKGIQLIGVKLKMYFPFEKNDLNELSDDISFG